MNIDSEIKKRKEQGLFRERKIITSPQGAQISVCGKKFLNFSFLLRNIVIGRPINDATPDIAI